MKIISRLRAGLKLAWIFLLWPVVALWPRNKKKIVFGAWFGNQFADNPKYFLKYILSLNLGFECVWVGKEEVRRHLKDIPGVEFARKDSWLADWHVLTAKWLCCCIGIDVDLTTFPTFGRAKQLNLWHGTLYKGASAKDWTPELKGSTLRVFVIKAINAIYHWAKPQESYSTFSYRRMCETMHGEAPWAFAVERSIAAGTPRIDYLVNNANNEIEIRRAREKCAAILGIPLDKRWFLYMPTFRKGLALKFSFMTSGRIADYQRILAQKNAIIVEKQHPQVITALNIESKRMGDIYGVSKEAATDIDTQELLLASDGLITDYSACFCDYLVLNRPIIHFAYDYDWYVNVERGVEFDLQDVAGGPIATNEQELATALAMSSDEQLAARGKHAGVLIECEKGKSCETFARWVGLV